jgi:hypothetical protein
MEKNLGQFMTPLNIATLVARELGVCDTVVDFAVGEGALLRAVQEGANKRVNAIGFDIDLLMIRAASAALPNAVLRKGDGLKVRLSAGKLTGRVGVVGNPPFIGETDDQNGWLKRAFKGLSGKLGLDRAEVQFLARSLVTARTTGGRAVIVMPIGFADGDIYRRIRILLMQQYRLIRCIEINAGVFAETEARTVILVIDTDDQSQGPTEICEVAPLDEAPVIIRSVILEPGARLDARYHKAMKMRPAQGELQLKDLKVTIARGICSRKEAETQNISILHTTDLGRVRGGKIIASSTVDPTLGIRHTVARKGDILLPRTGSRVRWEPVLVQAGKAPITDHVFRIRAPRKLQKIVFESFFHPSFDAWLQGVSKGVCATVLTKNELMQMPIFASSNHVAVSITS